MTFNHRRPQCISRFLSNMKNIHTFIYIIAAFAISFDVYMKINKSKYSQDVGLSVIDLVKKHGYPFERHGDVKTEDNYLLELHRIPYGFKNLTVDLSVKKRTPVLLIHCFLCSSADWLYMGPDKSIGYILADEGFDVWMGNHRGTTYSKKHLYLNPNNQSGEYWDFSLHEMGYYDIPAMVDYILEKTGEESLLVIGHSQGTTTTFALLSTRPEYNKKIRHFSAFSPAAYIAHNDIKSWITYFLWPYQWKWVNFIKEGEAMSKDLFFSKVSRFICKEDSYFFFLCKRGMMALIGTDSPKYDENILPIVMTHTPAGTSWKVFEHFHQMLRTAEYKQYDYLNEAKNLQVYNSTAPPSYNVSNVETTVALYYADSDLYVFTCNVKRLAQELKNVQVLHHIDDEKWSHVDFLWAEDAAEVLYKTVIKNMKKFS